MMRKQKILPARAIAAECITRIIQQQATMTQCSASFADHKDKTFIAALCYDVLRYYGFLKALANCLLNTPIKAKYANIDNLLLIGLYELWQQQTPDYACINSVVDAAKALNRSWACALLNRSCREFTRRRDNYLQQVKETPAYPAWWLQAWRHDWPADVEHIIAASQQRAPMIIRVNTTKISLADYQQRCTQVAIATEALPGAPQALKLSQPYDVTTLPGFGDGLLCVQDVTAQCAAPLMACAPGDRVLDACAAPGGKTTHLFECQPKIKELLALDHHPERLQKVIENVNRYQYPVHCIAADCLAVQDWWDGQPFDRILLDAPCSGSGVIRRHPDIAFARSPEMITELAATQLGLLNALWPTLRAGGKLLYVTCSIMTAENDAVIRAFVETQKDVQVCPITLAWGRATAFGWQCLPGEGQGDGFYFCCLEQKMCNQG